MFSSVFNFWDTVMKAYYSYILNRPTSSTDLTLPNCRLFYRFKLFYNEALRIKEPCNISFVNWFNLPYISDLTFAPAFDHGVDWDIKKPYSFRSRVSYTKTNLQ